MNQIVSSIVKMIVNVILLVGAAAATINCYRQNIAMMDSLVVGIPNSIIFLFMYFKIIKEHCRAQKWPPGWGKKLLPRTVPNHFCGWDIVLPEHNYGQSNFGYTKIKNQILPKNQILYPKIKNSNFYDPKIKCTQKSNFGYT